MLDEKYNPEHCEGCTEDCGLCMDTYKTEGGIKHTDTHGGLWYFDPEGFCVMRYAQRKCREELRKYIA